MTFLRSLAPKFWLILTGVGLVIALCLAISLSGQRKGENAVTYAKQSGRVEAIATGQAQTLEQLKDANDAEQALRAGGGRNAARFAQCLQDSDHPSACERYRPAPAVELVPR